MPEKPYNGVSTEAKKTEKPESKTETVSKLKKWIEADKGYYNEVYKTNIEYYENLYQCKRDVSEDTPTWRSNIFFPIPFYTIQDELPRTIDGIIGQNDFYTIYPRVDTKEGKDKALIREKLTRYYFDNPKSNFYAANHDAILRAKKWGAGWIDMTWMTEEGSNEYYDIKDGKIVQIKETENAYDGPRWDSYDIVYFDSGATCDTDIRRVTVETYFTASDVEALMREKCYDEAEIKKFLKEVASEEKDPCKRYLYQFVRTKNRWYGLLDEKYLIRDHCCPYKRNRIQMYKYSKYPEAGKIVGRGLCAVLADLTEEANDIQNLKVDNLILSVNKIFLKRSDAETPDMDIFPGAVLNLDNPETDLKTVEWNGVNFDAFKEIETIMGLSNRITGGAAGVTAPDGPQPINNKTATGALIVRNESNWRYAYEIKYNKRFVLRPMLRDLLDMIDQYQDPDKAKEILGEGFYKKFEVEPANYDASVDLEFYITGEEGLKGRQEELDAIMAALQIVGQIPNAINMINWPLILERVQKNLELPENFLLENAQGAQGLTLEQLSPEEQAQVGQMAQVLGVEPQAIIDRVNAGEDIKAIGAEAEAEMQGVQ